MQHSCEVIAVANQKGGTGKTTATACLAAGLAKAGKRTLAIDFDPQGDLSKLFGLYSGDDLPVSVTSLMGMVISDTRLNLDACIFLHSSGVNVIPADIQLAEMEITLVNTMSRESILRTCVHELRKQFDYILIDCCPSLGMLTINALASADSVLIPVQPHYMPAKGIEMLLRTIRKVRRQINPSLKIEGILVNMLDNRAVFTRDMAASLRAAYEDNIRVFDTAIPATVRAIEFGAKAVSIFDYAPESTAALAYEALTKEVLQIHVREKGKDQYR